MPTLLEVTKKVKDKAKEYIAAFEDLEKKQAPVAKFLDAQKNSGNEYIRRSQDEKPNPEQIKRREQLKSIVPYLESKSLTMSMVLEQKVSEKDFNEYIDAHNKIVRLHGQLHEVVTELRIEQSEVKHNEARKSKELEPAMKYAQKKLLHRMEIYAKKDKDFFEPENTPIIKLGEAYRNSCDSHLKYLENKEISRGFEEHRYHLNDLEKFATDRRAIQNYYRDLLPGFLVEHMPVDFCINVQPGSIKSMNTVDVVNRIKEFLHEPFKGEKNEVVANLTGLLKSIGLDLPKDKIEKIYDDAVVQQAAVVAPGKDFKPQ